MSYAAQAQQPVLERVGDLEIQIRHPTRPFGAFYEDLLLEA